MLGPKSNVSKASTVVKRWSWGVLDSYAAFKVSHNTVLVRLLGNTSDDEMRILFATMFSSKVVIGMDVDLEVTKLYYTSRNLILILGEYYFFSKT